MALLYRDPDAPLQTSRNESKIVTSDPLAIIYHEGLWRLNKVSPLNNFQFLPAKLKMYALKVRQAVVCAVQASSAKYSVKIEVLPYLKYFQGDPNGLVLTVTSTQRNGVSKVAYMAIFLSWGQNEKVYDAIHLPYMLERGEQKIGTAVKSTCQTLFDCNIKQFCFTQQQMLQIGFNFLDSDTPRSNDPFTFTYKSPRVDHKETLSLTFNVGDVSVIWNGIKEESANENVLINSTYMLLQNQIFYSLVLDITVFEITEISLPKSQVKSNGVVKMKTPESVNCVLTILNKISAPGFALEQ